MQGVRERFAELAGLPDEAIDLAEGALLIAAEAAPSLDVAHYLGELDALADESARACSARYGVTLDGAEAVRKILDTTAKLGWVRGGSKALPWRNRAIARLGRAPGVPTPVHDRPPHPPAAAGTAGAAACTSGCHAACCPACAVAAAAPTP